LAAPFYQGKVIKIIEGHEPGGGYDRVARLVAKHLPKHIPGKPTILVENVPGASSIIAANQLYNLAKPDGLTIGLVDRGLPVAQLLKVEGVKFDVTKFAWIGSAAVEGTVLCIRSDLPYKTFEEMRKTKDPIHLATVGPGTTSYQFPILLKEFLGVNIKFVNYLSSSAAMLAVERKEVDGRAGAFTSLQPFIERGLVHAVIRSKVAEPGTEKLPVDENMTTDSKAKTIMSMRAAGDLIGRPFLAPPKTPPELMGIIKNAFAQLSQDPELQQEAKKLKMPVEYVPSEEIMKVLNDLFSQPEEMVKEFGKYIKF